MFRNLIYSLITKGTVALINFLILIISSRYLGVSSRGEISLFILNITVIQIINEVYTGYNIVHFIPKFNLRKIIGFGIFYSLIFCSLSNTIVIFFNKQVLGFEWIGYIISLLVIINTFNCVLILGKENIKVYNLLSMIQPFLLLTGLSFSIFFLEKYTFVSYVYPLFFSFLVVFSISTIVVSGFFWKEPPGKNFTIRSILVNGFFFQSGNLLFIFANRYSYYILPGIASVGLYSSASSLMEALLIIVNGISPVLLARVANEGNTPKSAEVTLSLAKTSFLFSLGVFVIIAMVPARIFVSVLGDGFSGVKEVMMLYAPGVLLVGLFGPISNYFFALGKQRLVMLCYGLGFISTLVLAPLLIEKFGVQGAACNASIAYFIMAVGICVSFVVTNKLTLKRFFAFKADLANLKDLISAKP